MNISDLRQWQQYRREDLENWIGKQALAEIDEAFANMKEEHMIEITTKLPPAPAEAATPEYLEAFNLNARIHYCKDSVERGLAEMCVGIEKMRDGKQYKVLGYSNFEEYCQTEFGFSRMNGVRYADIGKMLNGQNVTSMLQNAESLGMTKLSLLAKLDEPTREALTEQVDVENATVKDLRNEINRITSENADLGQKLDAANETISTKERQWKASLESKQHELDEAQALGKKRYDVMMKRIRELNAQIEEAKAQPKEIAVEDTTRIEELQKELALAHAELEKCRKELAEKPMVQQALPNDGTDRRRGEYQAHLDGITMMMSRMLDFLDAYSDSSDFAWFCARTKENVRKFNNKLNELMTKEDPKCQ